MCCRARRRSSWTSVRKGLSVMNISPSSLCLQESSPFRAEAGLAGIIRSPAPEKSAADSCDPERADEDPRPDADHDRMKQERVVEPVAQRAKKDETRDGDQCDGGHADPAAGERGSVRQDMEDDRTGGDQDPD